MPQTATQLTPKHAKFVAALLAQPTLEAACKELGISHETGRRYLKEPLVKAAYHEACTEVLERSLSRLIRLVEPAIAVLSKALVEPDPNPVRLRAASILLDKALDIHRLSDHEARLSELEALVVGQSGSHHHEP